MAEYPPYVNGYGGISKLFKKIKEAAVPPKFSQDFMSTMLDLKSSSYRAMIPLLKRLGFLDQANVPTQAYKDFREESRSGTIMAERLREAYKELFAAHEYAQKLEKKDLQAKLKGLLGVAEDDGTIPLVASTFLELSKLATWNGAAPKPKKEPEEPQISKSARAGADKGEAEPKHEETDGAFRIGYTINLNLPATTEIEVFNAIFKSLRENLLRHL